MNIERWRPEQVWIYRQPVDMRKSILSLSIEQLDQLLDGYNLNGMRPHRTISAAHII